MIFLTEAIMLCLVFTAMVVPSVLKHPEDWASDMPPAVQQRCRELGILKPGERKMPPRVVARKVAFSTVAAAVMALVVTHVNGARSFGEGFLITYGLWLIVDWYDAAVIDCLWACHSKKCRVPGTEDMDEAYRNYGFHIKMSALGMVIGLPVALVTGLLTQLIAG